MLFSFQLYPSIKLLIFLLLLTPSTLSYILLSSSVRDLERTGTCFIQETTSWSATKIRAGQNIYTSCVNYIMLGGYGVLGDALQADDYYYKTYNGLPSHTMIYFAFTFFAIDSWNGSPDWFLIQFGGKTFTGWNTMLYTNFPASICGASNQDLPNVRIFGRVGHIGPSMTFRVVSKLDQISTNEAIGIRDINFHFVDNPPVTSEVMCGRASITLGTGDCICPEGQYETSTNQCAMCDYSCTSCFGSGPNQCYECRNGYSFDGIGCIQCHANCGDCSGPDANQCKSCKFGYILFQDNTCVPASECITPLTQTDCQRSCQSPCTDLTKFAYWDGRCLSTCTAPLTQTFMFDKAKVCLYPCNSGEWLYWDGTCLNSCPYTNRLDGTAKICDFPCTGNQFYYWNTTCSPVCKPPLKIRTQGEKSFCDYQCDALKHLYWDGTCGTSCDAPLVPRIEASQNYCDYPCETDQFLYWNTSCKDNCVTPLTQRVQNGRNFCDYKCTGTQHLHLDGTCDTSCNPPLVSRSDADGKKFCEKPCLSGLYLDWNNDCVSTCDSPLVSQETSGVLQCTYLCTGPSDYLYNNGSCKDNCKAPFRPVTKLGKKFCEPYCPVGQYELLNGTCIETCELPLYVSTIDTGAYCMLPCSDTSQYYHEDTQTCDTECRTSVVFEQGLYLKCLAVTNETLKFPIVRMVQYMRYIDIKIPLEIEKTSVTRGNNILSLRFSPSVFKNLREKFTNVPLPEALQKPGLSSSFMANFLDDLVILGILLTVEIIRTVLDLCFGAMQSSSLQESIRKLRVLTRWNLPLIFFATNLGDIFFFSILEFKTFNSDNPGTVLSSSVCMVMLLSAIGFIGATFLLVRGVSNAKVKGLKDPIYTGYIAKRRNLQVFFGGNEEESGLDPSFFGIYCVRQVIPMIIAGSLYTVPLLQVIAYCVITAGILIYILYKNPIKKTVDHINLVVIEIATLLINLSTLVFFILDKNNNLNGQSASIAGTIIIVCNYVITFAAIGFLVTKIMLIMNDATRLRLDGKIKQEKSILWQLLFVPFQQGCFGFEQIQINGEGFIKPKKIEVKDRLNPVMTEENKLFSPMTEIGAQENNLTTEINLDSSDTPKPNKLRLQKAYEMLDQNTKVSLPNDTTVEIITQEDDPLSKLRRKVRRDTVEKSQIR